MSALDRHPGIQPRPSLGRTLDRTARAAFPGACTLALMLLLNAPIGLPDQAQLLPAVAVGGVWFWSVHRPGSMPALLVLALGLALDFLAYLPIGVGVFALLAVHGLAGQWRSGVAGLGFVGGWIMFAIVCAGAAGLIWGLASALTVRMLPVRPAVFEAVVATAIYPALAALYLRANRGVADPVRA